MLSRNDLHPYQLQAVQFIKDTPSCALWLDMGLGKTVSTLSAIRDMLGAGMAKRVLIIAPLRVATATWPNEIKRWDYLSNMKLNVLAGLPVAARKRAADLPAQISVINRELVPWLVEHFGQKWPYDMVVIDESSAFKSTQAKRWRALRSVLPKIKRMVQLTATPAANNLIDLWPQIYLLDRGERLGKTKGMFLEKFCRSVGNPQWNQWEVKPERKAALYTLLADITIRMKAEDYLDVPDRIDSVIQVSPAPKWRKQYAALQKDFVVALDQGEITAVNVAVQTGKLLQNVQRRRVFGRRRLGSRPRRQTRRTGRNTRTNR